MVLFPQTEFTHMLECGLSVLREEAFRAMGSGFDDAEKGCRKKREEREATLATELAGILRAHRYVTRAR